MVRVKWRGKSSPHSRRRGWQGKPHPVQDQTEYRSYGSLPWPATDGIRVGRLRLPVTVVRDRWSSPVSGTEPGLHPPHSGGSSRKAGSLRLFKYKGQIHTLPAFADPHSIIARLDPAVIARLVKQGEANQAVTSEWIAMGAEHPRNDRQKF